MNHRDNKTARTPQAGNITDALPADRQAEESADILVERGNVRVERIVSTGQTTPEGTWYDQEQDEWVMVASGAARLRIDGEDTDRELSAGDWIWLPTHCRHRVTWSQSSPPTIWIAVHF